MLLPKPDVDTIKKILEGKRIVSIQLGQGVEPDLSVEHPGFTSYKKSGNPYMIVEYTSDVEVKRNE
jgi:hypothetical protein